MTTIPYGALNVAADPKPFIDEAAPLPANVVTAPSGVMCRNRLFPPSAAITFPAGSIATELREQNLAATPRPSTKPVHILLAPASVVTTPKGVTIRMR